MPKLQSANGRLNVLSKSGCFFFYHLFLLFELCHITISLQGGINTSSRPPRCGVVSRLHPRPCDSILVEGTCSTLLRKEVLACCCFVGFEKTWMLEARRDLWYPIHRRDKNFGMWGGLQTVSTTLKSCKYWSVQLCSDAHENKVTALRCLTPIFWRWHSPNPQPTAEALGMQNQRDWQGGQVSVTTTLTPAKATKSKCHLVPAKQEEDRWT